MRIDGQNYWLWIAHESNIKSCLTLHQEKDVFTLTNIIVHKGDTVTIHFYNTADEPEDRHTFTMQSPYKMNYDLAGGQSKTFSFKANTVGGFTYYCNYDLPSMIGHLEVLP